MKLCTEKDQSLGSERMMYGTSLSEWLVFIQTSNGVVLDCLLHERCEIVF